MDPEWGKAGEMDTEGKDFHEEAKIVKDHKGVEHFFMPCCYSKRINQHSRSLLQAWRANDDVELLIYRSDPDLPDVGEIKRCSSICCGLCRQEIQNIQSRD